ncbi:MAG TPA: hypothetical protein VK973_10425 [Arenicellales bacterium]|nr:hypothetical protein [Arenicellales bacterium]
MLYALPDHEVMEQFLPGIGSRRLPVRAARARLLSNPGLVPVAVDPTGGGAVYFADIGDAPLVEWKYIYTIERLAGEGSIGESFSTDLSILDEPDVAGDSVEPHGLIFHVSRCGSTLFTKALARSPANLTISQGGPLQEGFWAVVTDDWQHPPEPDERSLRRLRNLVALMARRRRPELERCFVKFISWNIIYLDFIRAAFPRVPAVYLYRDPVEVIATVMQETTAVLRARGTPRAESLTGLPWRDTAAMDDAEYLARCYVHYFDIVERRGGEAGLGLVNFEQLRRPDCFPAVLARGLNLHPDSGELETMRAQYRFYSKDDSDSTPYSGEPETLAEVLDEEQRRVIVEITGEHLARLDRSAHNVFAPDADSVAV